MKNPIELICDKCEKPMPIDQSESNENWTVYLNECPCGGKSKIKLSNNEQ